MKIAVIGYSGAGKSTLARELAEAMELPVWHFDRVQFLPGWQIRTQEEKLSLTEEFLNSHESWVMDGNYSKLCFERRMAEADEIVFLDFNRFSCLKRAFLRFLRYRKQTRPDMADGCTEKFDLAFASWILYKGRGRQARARYRALEKQYADKFFVLNNQKQLDAYRKSRGLTEKKQSS